MYCEFCLIQLILAPTLGGHKYLNIYVTAVLKKIPGKGFLPFGTAILSAPQNQENLFSNKATSGNNRVDSALIQLI